MAKRTQVPAEEYGMDHDVGPVLLVSDDRMGARFEAEVGYWGIVIRLDYGEVLRLRDQLSAILEGRSNG